MDIPNTPPAGRPRRGFARLFVSATTGLLCLLRSDGSRLTVGGSGGGDMLGANNLSEITNAGTARTNLALGSMATQAAGAVSISGGSITGITDLAVADGGTGASNTATARVNLGLRHAGLGGGLCQILPGTINGTWLGVGFPVGPGIFGTGTDRVGVANRPHQRFPTSPASTNGATVGGLNQEAGNNLMRCNPALAGVWSVYFFFQTGASASIRGGMAVSNGNITDVDKLANNSIGIRLRPSISTTLFGYATDNAGTTTTATLGVGLSASTAYVAEVLWDGTNAKMRIATVNTTTGVWGSWSTQASISANLPATTLGLAPTMRWYCEGTPATNPVVDIGGADQIPYIL